MLTTVVTIVLGLASSLHLGNLLWGFVSKKLSQPVDIHTPSAKFNQMFDAFGNTAEQVVLHHLSGEQIDTLLSMIAQGANSSAIMAWLSATAGKPLMDEFFSVLGPLVTQEAHLLLGGEQEAKSQAMKTIATAASQVATTKAATQLSAQQVAAGLMKMSAPAVAK